MHNRIPGEIVTKPGCGGELRQAAPHATGKVPSGEKSTETGTGEVHRRGRRLQWMLCYHQDDPKHVWANDYIQRGFLECLIYAECEFAWIVSTSTKNK